MVPFGREHFVVHRALRGCGNFADLGADRARPVPTVVSGNLGDLGGLGWDGGEAWERWERWERWENMEIHENNLVNRLILSEI